MNTIKETNVFEKKTVGKTFDEEEALKLSQLLGFQKPLIEYLSKQSAK